MPALGTHYAVAEQTWMSGGARHQHGVLVQRSGDIVGVESTRVFRGSAAIITLVLLGKLLEARAKARPRRLSRSS